MFLLFAARFTHGLLHHTDGDLLFFCLRKLLATYVVALSVVLSAETMSSLLMVGRLIFRIVLTYFISKIFFFFFNKTAQKK